MYIFSSIDGYFGSYGGAYVPEILWSAIHKLTTEYEKASRDEHFWGEYARVLTNMSGRPTPLTYAENLTRHFGSAKIYLKREDLNHTGSHKFNNVVGQWLLAKRLGKTRIIAETGAGQHGLATATMAAKFGLECVIYMGAKDVARQHPNVFWMEKLGARVIAVEHGNRTLKDAVNAAFKDWIGDLGNTHYILGTACGPHPYPEMVARFQSIIGEEARKQMQEQSGILPSAVYACVGGGSNATGIFSGFMDHPSVELVAIEAGGKSDAPGMHAARIARGAGTPGIAQGYKTRFLQDGDGQLRDTHSIAAGLDYVGISPILSDLHEKKQVRFELARDVEVIEAHSLLMRKEGIIAALESSHALAGAFREMKKYTSHDAIIINISGRWDKDIFTIAEAYDDPEWKEFLRTKAF